MILLVEDEQHLAKAMQRYLSTEGYRCECAPDGHAAIERLQRDPVPALVLLDYRMPGVDGLEVLRFIRSQPTTATLPVVMMSGDLGRCPETAQKLLQKPFELDELLAAVQRHSQPAPM